VLRLRVEAEQFLLSCIDIKTLVDWVQALNAAIALALPLDERRQPELYVAPTTRRPGDTVADEFISQQRQIISRQYPNLGSSQTVPRNPETLARANENEELGQEFSRILSLTEQPIDEEDEGADGDQQIRRTNSASSRPRTSASDKQPVQQIETVAFPMTRRYTRRYMDSVLFNSRRRTPFVMYHGRRHLVNWRESRLTVWKRSDGTIEDLGEPPNYSSASKDAHVEELTLQRVQSSGSAGLGPTGGWRHTMRERT
jgi:hypothetical protein